MCDEKPHPVRPSQRRPDDADAVADGLGSRNQTAAGDGFVAIFSGGLRQRRCTPCADDDDRGVITRLLATEDQIVFSQPSGGAVALNAEHEGQLRGRPRRPGRQGAPPGQGKLTIQQRRMSAAGLPRPGKKAPGAGRPRRSTPQARQDPADLADPSPRSSQESAGRGTLARRTGGRTARSNCTATVPQIRNVLRRHVQLARAMAACLTPRSRRRVGPVILG